MSKWLVSGIVAVCLLVGFAASAYAHDGWRHGGGHHRGWHHGEFRRGPALVTPPYYPRYYSPPVVVYAPPPPRVVYPAPAYYDELPVHYHRRPGVTISIPPVFIGF